MENKSYRITSNGKMLILQFLLAFIAILSGLMFKISSEDKKWDMLIYNGIKVGNLDLSGKTISEGKKIISSQYINPILKKKISIITKEKIYNLENSKLIVGYDMDNAVNKAFSFGKNLTTYEKIKLLKTGLDENYDIAFIYDEDYIETFIKELSKESYRSPINANIVIINKEKVKINPDIKGYRLDEEKLKEIIKKRITNEPNKNIKIEAPYLVISADITTDELSSVNAKIASFSTSFEYSLFERVNNIELAADSINGKILMPNETFSFNECVGERTKKRGFMEAPVIVDNKIKLGVGGGICQVSTTLYNVVLKAGLKPIERTHHTLPVSYVKLGLDATVNWDDIDFKFKNTLHYPLYIQAYTNNKMLYVNFYSNFKLLKREYLIVNDRYKTTKPSTKITNNLYLNKDQTVSHYGRGEQMVKVIRYEYENGAIINSEIISNDVYLAFNNIKN